MKLGLKKPLMLPSVADPIDLVEARRAIERLTAKYHPHSRTPRELRKGNPTGAIGSTGSGPRLPAAKVDDRHNVPRWEVAPRNRARKLKVRTPGYDEPAAGVRELLRRENIEINE